MQKSDVVFELTDGELRAFSFSVSSFRQKLIHSSTAVKFDRIPIPTGLIEQGAVRDEESLKRILSDYRSQHPGKLAKAYLAVSMQQGFIGAYTLPWLSKRDRESAISLLVDEEISIPKSELYYDYFIFSEEKPKRLKIVLGATRRSILEQYAFIFDQAGFPLNEIDFAYSALGQAFGFEADQDVLYLQGESKGVKMISFRGGVPKSLRLLSSFSADDAYSETDLHEERKNEIGRFLLYHQTQQPDYNLQRIVWSGGSDVSRLAQELYSTNSNLLLEQAAIKDLPDSWQKVLEQNRGVAEVALGYGLGVISQRPGLNLWHQPFAKGKLMKAYLRLGLAATILLITGTLIWLSLSQLALPLQDELSQLSREGTDILEQNQQQAALLSAWKKASVNREKIGERLAEVQALTGSELEIKQITFKNGSLSIQGSANDSKNVQAFIKALRILGWADPSLSSYKMTVESTVDFIINAKQVQMSTQLQSLEAE
ncbi:competence protein ComA [Desulfosporosinus sp. HMP52]|uniref:hypothetical protein n=1 Tax=Desulfosporosinus sp. HMP52 TaxID=1487923 RepID=UPI00051FAEE5|nr:hypothetical protein [Desulfosporosinus sp. HMP52]KGK86367.1 competence protein ComA [Desulfosporosinus sp. HMP52]